MRVLTLLCRQQCKESIVVYINDGCIYCCILQVITTYNGLGHTPVTVIKVWRY